MSSTAEMNKVLGEGAGSYSRLQDLFREFEGIGEGAGARTLEVQKDFVGIGEAVGVIARRLELFRTFFGIGGGEGTRTLTVRKDVISGIGEGAATLDRAVVFVRDFWRLEKGTCSSQSFSFVTSMLLARVRSGRELRSIGMTYLTRRAVAVAQSSMSTGHF